MVRHHEFASVSVDVAQICDFVLMLALQVSVMPTREKFGRGLRAEQGFREGQTIMDVTCLWFSCRETLNAFVGQE